MRPKNQLGKRVGKNCLAPKNEGQVTVYISGYEAVLPEFEKEYPGIKVVSVSGRGSQFAQRLITERRGEKYLADVLNAGGVTTTDSCTWQRCSSRSNRL